MINFDNVRKEKIKERNSNWSKIPDDLYRLLIIGSFRRIFLRKFPENISSENRVFRKQKRTAVYGVMDSCP